MNKRNEFAETIALAVRAQAAICAPMRIVGVAADGMEESLMGKNLK